MNLIIRADPYQDHPLEDHADDIAELISATVGGNVQAGGHGGQRRGDHEVAPHAGKWYQKFVEEINDAQENRDAQLTLLEVSLGLSTHFQVLGYTNHPMERRIISTLAYC